MRRIATTVAASLAAVLVLLGLGASPASAADPWDCKAGQICFYSGANGTGSKCAWSGDDPDWTSGGTVCSWARTTNVKSVYNRGQTDTFTGVVFFGIVKDADISDEDEGRKGCTRRGQQGNLAGTYKVLAHKWTRGRCG